MITQSKKEIWAHNYKLNDIKNKNLIFFIENRF